MKSNACLGVHLYFFADSTAPKKRNELLNIKKMDSKKQYQSFVRCLKSFSNFEIHVQIWCNEKASIHVIGGNLELAYDYYVTKIWKLFLTSC